MISDNFITLDLSILFRTCPVVAINLLCFMLGFPLNVVNNYCYTLKNGVSVLQKEVDFDDYVKIRNVDYSMLARNIILLYLQQTANPLRLW